MDSIEIYHEERAEASPEARLDFPTYNEWMHNLCDPHAERIRAEERIAIREYFEDY